MKQMKFNYNDHNFWIFDYTKVADMNSWFGDISNLKLKSFSLLWDSIWSNDSFIEDSIAVFRIL